MASTETLTSLAMLKVHVDHGHDYLDYLRPFVLQVLVDNPPSPVTDSNVARRLLQDFGLAIPPRAVQLVLKRIAKTGAIKLNNRVYEVTGTISNPELGRKKADASRHIASIVAGLVAFADDLGQPVTESEAVAAVCEFLTEFNVECLQAYLRGTAIPNNTEKQRTRIVLVGEFVLHLQRTSPERFESFIVIVQGHMLANALLCPDLRDAPKSYKGVTFFLDTPLLIQHLALEGLLSKQAVDELIKLLHHLGGKVATFSHSRDELMRVLSGVADHIGSPDGRSRIAAEARRSNTTRSDLLLMASTVDERLADAHIEVVSTPLHVSRFQIDESVFEGVLEDEISYLNVRAKHDDINSVRSIYVLRANTAPGSLERSKAVLVTSNAAFARAACEFGKTHEHSQEVSSVISDFSLANVAWLKAPLGAPGLPTAEVLAVAYAALRPSQALLEKYLFEIERLRQAGKITTRDHQLLRSSPAAQAEMMKLTLGEEAELTEATLGETLRRVTAEMTREEATRAEREAVQHDETRAKLQAAQSEKAALTARIYWSCKQAATLRARVAASVVVVVVVLGTLAGVGVKADDWRVSSALLVALVCLGALSAWSFFTGGTLATLQQRIEAHFLKNLLRDKAAELGITLELPRAE